MAQWLELHPENPQTRWISRAAEQVRDGGVVVYPTDSCYALGCAVGNKTGAERMRRIRNFGRGHLFTLVCRDLSEIATYARVDNSQYRLLKLATPGAYTFVLEATRELPRRILHERRKTIGIRVPDNRVAQMLLEAVGAPLLSCTLKFPDAEFAVNQPQDEHHQLDGLVDVVLDDGPCGVDPTTVIDFSGGVPEVTRQGLGSTARLNL
ncbi:MAG: threonylcarbamoyl-AMP synthase [Sinobacteraceae bacterium]|nr:threonylcarbamoyl-AMP synthase [Nevskiaceae bacterium]